MKNNYKLIIFFFLLFELYLKSFSSFINDEKALNYILQHNIVAKNILKIENPQNGEENQKPPYYKEDIFKEYEKLLEKDKELQQSYDKYYLQYIEQTNQLKIDKIRICLLIIIACFLAILIIIYVCYELYKYRKNKKQMNIYGESVSKIYSFGKEIKISESTKSNEESYKKNSSYNLSQIGDLGNSSNFNIFVKDNENEEKKEKEKEISFNQLNDGDEAPIQFNENNNNVNNINNINNMNNINNNVYNDDIKTLTNDENVYFASKTDKILYKPYSEEEINNK